MYVYSWLNMCAISRGALMRFHHASLVVLSTQACGSFMWSTRSRQLLSRVYVFSGMAGCKDHLQNLGICGVYPLVI